MSIKLNAQSGGSVALDAPTQTTNSNDITFKLPVADGSADQHLKTDGSGNLGFATPMKWVQESIATVTSGTSYEFTNIPSTAKEILIRFDGISFSGNGNHKFVLGNSGGYSTSNYIISRSYEPGGNYQKGTDGIEFNGTGSSGYTVTGKLHLWYPIHGNLWWVEGIAFPSSGEGQYQHRVTGQADAGGTLTKIKLFDANNDGFDSTGNAKVQISYLSY